MIITNTIINIREDREYSGHLNILYIFGANHTDDALAFTALALTPPTNLKKKCASAARKLGTSQANVESTIESLSYLLNTASEDLSIRFSLSLSLVTL